MENVFNNHGSTMTYGGVDQQDDEEDDGPDPQQVEGESGTEEDQDKQEKQQENDHESTLPLGLARNGGMGVGPKPWMP
jgi:hypothetical protein